MTRTRNPEQLTAFLLIGVMVIEAPWIVLNFVHGPAKLMAYLGFTPEGIGTGAG